MCGLVSAFRTQTWAKNHSYQSRVRKTRGLPPQNNLHMVGKHNSSIRYTHLLILLPSLLITPTQVVNSSAYGKNSSDEMVWFAIWSSSSRIFFNSGFLTLVSIAEIVPHSLYTCKRWLKRWWKRSGNVWVSNCKVACELNWRQMFWRSVVSFS